VVFHLAQLPASPDHLRHESGARHATMGCLMMIRKIGIIGS